MKFYGIEMKGKYILEKLNDLPSFNTERDEGRIIYSLLDNRLYLGTNDRWIYLSGIEIVETLPSWTSTDEGKVVYLTEDEYLYYGDNSNWRKILTVTDLETALTGHIGVGGTEQHPVVTSEVAGFMSAADKSALDGHIEVGGTDQHPVVTSSVAGFMSATDKDNLDGHIGVGGDQHPVATPSVAGFMSAADKSALEDHIGVGGTGQHPVVTSSVAGFMSAADKTILNNIDNIYLIKAGDTITGIVDINSTGWTATQLYNTFRVRQSRISNNAPNPADGNNGDVWYQYI